MSKNKMIKKREIDSLLDSVTKELYEERRDNLNQLHHDDCEHDSNDDCDDESDEDCIEDAICDILKSQKNIMGCMEDMFCKLSDEIDRLPSTSDKVNLYKKLLCAYAKKDCSMAKLLKALAKLEKVNNERDKDHRGDRDNRNCRGCNGQLFRRC